MSKPWQIVAVLFIVACLNYADRSAITAVFPLLRSELGLSDLEMAPPVNVPWAYALGSPFAGRLADLFSRSRMVVYRLIGWSLVTLATGFVTSTSQLLTTRVLLGVAECAYLPSAVALIADHHGPRSRATAMGVHLAGLNFDWWRRFRRLSRRTLRLAVEFSSSEPLACHGRVRSLPLSDGVPAPDARPTPPLSFSPPSGTKSCPTTGRVAQAMVIAVAFGCSSTGFLCTFAKPSI
ncbi:MAG: MFS transporter [Bryobacteraceae bacterium]